MAQAFDIPTGNRIASSGTPSSTEFPGTFQIAAPGRPDPTSRIDNLEYGSGFGLPQARRYARKRPAADLIQTRCGPILGLGDPRKVNQFCRI
jgi:hypothetical protein